MSMDGVKACHDWDLKHCSISSPLFDVALKWEPKQGPKGDPVVGVGARHARGTESPIVRVQETCRTVT